MATVTQLDILNAVQYLSNRESLSFISRWRSVFPHILIDYSIRWATNDDYYVPPPMRQTSAIVVEIIFSKEGCEAMSCFPYTETGVIDFMKSPIGGYTQTSNTAVQYNQPACFNLDSALAARDGKIQSVELRYTSSNKCVMVDSFTKAWLNAPYIRTDAHVVRGVDDVPGFDVSYDDDPAFPERIKGKFNTAYCRRFGRSEINNSCSQPWYETFVSFVLGESILTTFKLASTNVFDDLRDFDYSRPSNILPPAPPPEGDEMLFKWLNTRDTTVDVGRENNFLNNKFDMVLGQSIIYVANEGFSTVATQNTNMHSGLMENLLMRRREVLQNNINYSNKKNPNQFSGYENSFNVNPSTDELEIIIIQFLEDHAFIMSILTDLGFSVLESSLSSMLQQLNKVLIPSLKRMLSLQSRRVTAALLGETYKAAMINALNRAFISTISTVAKATARTVRAAASIANLALTFLTIADLVLMIWDPFGYSNMFPRGYLDDLSSAFLSAYYESIDAPTRDIIEFKPQHFSNLIIDEEEEYFVEGMLHLADYLAVLDVNSNGQVIDLLRGVEVYEVNDEEIIGASLASTTWAYFKWFCARHDALIKTPNANKILVVPSIVLCVAGLIYSLKYHSVLQIEQQTNIHLCLLLIILLSFLLLFTPSVQYYSALIKHRYD
ncbi:P74 [Choristoneura occidentalis granulovirus]|uniref:Envelope protein n=3 Tax=Betabaculovirus chofumiferanae TaxID=3051997 RepID=Q8V9Y3_GVCF|nr:P74 [Choristoneura fumiferana granulovirus]AAL13071.2 envelope protein [Choristoneura fumiferana granulovirus]ABC61180.1 P74 [Choristoneura fumiferana granulovirus]